MRSLPASLMPKPKISPAAGLAEEEVEGVVAAVAEDLRDPRPDEVHVHGERRGRGGAGEPHLRAHGVVEAPAEAAELRRHEGA